MNLNIAKANNQSAWTKIQEINCKELRRMSDIYLQVQIPEINYKEKWNCKFNRFKDEIYKNRETSKGWSKNTRAIALYWWTKEKGIIYEKRYCAWTKLLLY